jgi:hypothetical protein
MSSPDLLKFTGQRYVAGEAKLRAVRHSTTHPRLRKTIAGLRRFPLDGINLLDREPTSPNCSSGRCSGFAMLEPSRKTKVPELNRTAP